MKFLLSLLALFLSIQFTWAERLQTRIEKIELSEDAHYPHLLLLENGRVATVEASEKSSLDALRESLERRDLIALEVAPDNKLISMTTLEDKEKESLMDPDPEEGPFEYHPTNLATVEQASAIFKNFSRRYQRASQCYNRAHIWAYEEWKRSNFQSIKLFMFFTKRYIWDYNYKWWFHVTPMTFVNGTAMTLDRAFSKGPETVKNWTLRFIYSRRDCKMVNKYSQYENNQQTEHCYLIPSTMYFWQPRDLDNYERTGTQKKSFIKGEVNHAYWEAF